MSDAEAVAAAVAGWWDACLARPGELPEGVEPVQQRLVRQVGRGALPDGRVAFLKLMAFPRARDRLRYCWPRPLPAVHEARMLAEARRAGLVCPRVLAVRGARRGPLPYLSLLVLEGLDVAGPADLDAALDAARALGAAGLLHDDLNPGNVLRLADGRTAILDLQSARRRRPPLYAEGRRSMAAKILLEDWPGAPAGLDARLAAAQARGLFTASRAADVASACAARQRRDLLRRIHRCLVPSTEFAVERSRRGVLRARRACGQLAVGAPPECWHHGGREMARMWIGDRTLEVCLGSEPLLGALFRNSLWRLPRWSVYIPAPDGLATLAARSAHLLEGYDLYRRIRGGRWTATQGGAGLVRRGRGRQEN